MLNDSLPNHIFNLDGSAQSSKTGETLTKEEVEQTDTLYQQRMDLLPHYNEWQWGEIFKESPQPAINGLKQRIEEDRLKIRILNERKKTASTQFTAFKDHWWLELIHERYNKDIVDLRREIKSWEALISQLRNRGKAHKEADKQKITGADIQLAKDIPMVIILDGEYRHVGNTLVGKCPFHTDRTPSFTVFLKTNTWYCFSACGEGGDTIAYMMKKTGADFITTIKFLLGRP